MSPLPNEQIARFGPGDNVPVYATTAGGAISAGRLVQITGKNTRGGYTAVHAGAGEWASGVAERSIPAPDSGAIPDVRHGTNINRVGAIAFGESGAAVTAGVEVASDATGRFVAATTGDVVQGRALTAATAAGQYIEIDRAHTGHVVPA